MFQTAEGVQAEKEGHASKVREVQAVLHVYAWQEDLPELECLQSKVKGKEEGVHGPLIRLHPQTRPQDFPKAENVCKTPEGEESRGIGCLLAGCQNCGKIQAETLAEASLLEEGRAVSRGRAGSGPSKGRTE